MGPVDHNLAIDILSKVNKGNWGNVKKLTQTERKVLTAMMAALESGKDIQAPKEILTRIILKLDGPGAAPTRAQRTASEVKTALKGVFTNQGRIKTKDLLEFASTVQGKVNIAQQQKELKQWKLIAKEANKTNFPERCRHIKGVYSDLAATYNTEGRKAAIEFAENKLKNLRNWVAAEPKNEAQQAMVERLEIPILERKIRLLKSNLSSKQLKTEWSKKSQAWSDPKNMQAVIDRYAGFTQPSYQETMRWYLDKSSETLNELQTKMHSTYNRLNEIAPQARIVVLEGAINDLKGQMADAKEVHGIVAKAHVNLLDRAIRDLEYVKQSVLRSPDLRRASDINAIESAIKRWSSPENAKGFILPGGR